MRNKMSFLKAKEKKNKIQGQKKSFAVVIFILQNIFFKI